MKAVVRASAHARSVRSVLKFPVLVEEVGSVCEFLPSALDVSVFNDGFE